MKLQLGFYKSKNILDRIVSIFGNTKYSHVCLISNNYKIEAIIPAGVRKADIKSYGGSWQLDIYNVNIPTKAQVRIWSDAYQKIGKKYDYKGVLHFVFWWYKQSKYRYFCSELVAEVFQNAGYPLSHKAPSNCTPEDLVHSGILEYDRTIWG